MQKRKKTIRRRNDSGRPSRNDPKSDRTCKPDKAPAKTETEGATPEKYEDLRIPEGVTGNETDLGEFASFVKEEGLSPAQAQKLLDLGGEKLRAITEASNKVWLDRQASWEADVKKDPAIGGRAYERNVAEARRVFIPGKSNPLISTAEEAHALKRALCHTGAGSNPAVVRLFIRAGRLIQARAAQAKLNDAYPTMG
jgi:hypothetical protein